MKLRKVISEPVIDIELSRLRLHQVIKKVNKSLDCSDKRRIKPNLTFTFSRLVYLLSKHYRELEYNQWIQPQYMETLNELDLSLPHAISYIANNDQTEGSEQRIWCKRTVENHLKRLEELGLIKRVRINSKTAILIHPELLFFTPSYQHLYEKLSGFFTNSWKCENTEKCSIQEIITKKVHTRYPTLETSIKSINAEVKMLKRRNLDSSLETDKRNYNSLLETITEETPKTKKPAKQPKKPLAPAGGKISEKDAYEQQVQQYLQNLWVWMLKNCYTEQNYSFIAKSERRYFNRFFKDKFATTGDHKKLYESIKSRLRMWQKFLEDCEDNNRPFKTPLPSIFFDWRNRDSNSFNITKLYLVKEKTRLRIITLNKKSVTCFKKFKAIQEDNTLKISEKIKEQKKISWSMNTHRKEAPSIVIAWEEKVSRYLTGDFYKNYGA